MQSLETKGTALVISVMINGTVPADMYRVFVIILYYLKIERTLRNMNYKTE